MRNARNAIRRKRTGRAETPVTDDYFGVKVVDPYRWMEDRQSPEFSAWVTAQGRHARTVLDAIPHRNDIARALKEDTTANPNRLVRAEIRGSRIFSLRQLAAKGAPVLFVRDGLDSADRLLLDPNADGDGHRHAIVEFAPSWNGRSVAYAIDTDGGETGPLRVVDVASAKEIDGDGPAIAYPNVQWLPDDASFSYQHRSGDETKGSRIVALHRLGTAYTADRDLVGHGVADGLSLAVNERPELTYSPDSAFAVLGVATSDAGKRRFYVADRQAFIAGNAQWRLVAGIDDGVTSVLPHGNDLYLVSANGAPHYRVLETPATAPDLQKASIVVPESGAILQGPGDFPLAGYGVLHPAKDALYVAVLDSGSNGLLRVPWHAPATAARIPMPYENAIREIATDLRRDGCWFGITGWTHAGQHFRYDPHVGHAEPSGLQPQVPGDNPADLVAEDVTVPARDGVRIPLTLIHRAGMPLDGTAPTILYGYGAYGSPLMPFLNTGQLEWYRLGGLAAIAHVRGGGEFGEEWHLAGKGSNKPNTWRDAIDCAHYLVGKNYTTPARLGILSGSAGGVLAGRAITEEPGLFAAAIMTVPVMDTLRFETQGAGRANRDEFGSVTTEGGFHALYEMSTYEHVQPGVRYPAILLTTGLNDRRVPLWEPTKAFARFAEDSTSKRPVLLRVDALGGHGLASNDADALVAEAADWYAFLLWQFGIPGYAPTVGAGR